MSTHAEILEVHTAESKLKLKPHLVVVTENAGPLRVKLAELFGPELMKKLKEMRLL